MNRLEVNAKRQIIDVLRKEGYATYARLFDLFDLRLTSDPSTIAYMIPSKAVIVINKNLDIDQVSMIVRHEILHEYLTHAERADAWYKAHSMLPNATIRNIAADYEISNVGYTDRDKKIAKSIRLGDQTLKGLVTEQDHPGWENKTFEEMLEELEKESDEIKQQLKQMMKDLEVDPSELDKIQDEADEMSDEAGQQQQGSGSGKSRGSKSDKDSQQQSGSGDNEDSDEQQGSESKDSDSKEDSKSKDSSNGEDNSSSSNSSSSDKYEPQGNTQKGGELSSKEVEDIKRRADEISSDITVTKAELSDLESGSDGEVFGDGDDQAKKAELADRVKRIKKEFNDLKKSGGGGLLSEVEQKRVKEIEAQRERAEVRYTKNDLYKFRNSLNRFIKSQIASQKGSSWSKFNRRYEGSGIVAPGSTRFSNGKIPVVHVYWDVSGSFSDPKKTAGARDAIASINKFVQNGLIRAKTFYFADTVAETREQAGSSNSDAPVPHIQMTKPDNVIIITDDNPGGIESDVTVPGGVWFLFFDSRSQDLIDHLHGKQLTQVFDIDY